MQTLLLWGFYFVTLYAFLPGLISRLFGFRVFKKGIVDREISLTFDDGPDPLYTPQLLDLLARYGAKATFFVVGSHAEKHPEILARMRDEGHVIGIHNYVHRTNWLMRPKSVKDQIVKTSRVIREATGLRAAFYRPPWGVVNLFDFAKSRPLQIVLWSAIFGDWRINLGEEKLTKKMLNKLRPGEVLLLHDCGQTPGAHPDAPRNMLKALEVFLEKGTKKGIRFVGIDEMVRLTAQFRSAKKSIWKRFIVSLWLLWENLFHLMFKLKPVGDKHTTFYYRVTKYSGEPVEMSEGGRLVKGERVAELHFDNKNLNAIASRSSSPLSTMVRLIRDVQKGLPLLHNLLLQDPEAQDVRAVFGITMIHQGSDRVGFEIHQLPDGLFSKVTSIYLNFLFSVLTTNKRKKNNEKHTKLVPKMLIMPIGKLQSMYGSTKTASSSADSSNAMNSTSSVF